MTDYSNLVTDDLRNLDGATNGSPTPRDELALYIREDNDVSLSIRTIWTSNDGIPMSEWHGLTRRIVLAKGPGVVDLDSLKRDLAEGGNLAKLVSRIADGLSSEWDGSNNKGRLTEDAQEAEGEIESLIYRGRLDYIDETWSTWEESEWIWDLAKSTITASTSDEEIKAFLTETRETAPSDKVILRGDATDDLIEMRDEMKAKLDDVD